jgi:hypothetical protein
MRALCGAIIAAGALIGLGLAALGVGQRYAELSRPDNEGKVLLRDYSGNNLFSRGLPDKDHGLAWVNIGEMDRGLAVTVTALIIALLIGIATAFIGLAFHHHRRHLEMQHWHGQAIGPHSHTPAGH